MRPLALPLLFSLLLAGCTTHGEDHAGHDAATRADDPMWTFTQRLGEEEPSPLGNASGFAVDKRLEADGGMRQIGGQWHSGVPRGKPFHLAFDASVPMRVSFRLVDASGAATSGTCDWGERWETEKEVALGRAQMRNNATACEIRFTPSIDLRDDDGPTLHWEARSASAEEQGWRLRFRADAEVDADAGAEAEPESGLA